jgi:hypothetical protein
LRPAGSHSELKASLGYIPSASLKKGREERRKQRREGWRKGGGKGKKIVIFKFKKLECPGYFKIFEMSVWFQMT